MPKVNLYNFILGFSFILLASCAGPFLGEDVYYSYLYKNEQLTHAWGFELMKSAHAHTNLFGMLHILLGLTLPYSGLKKLAKAQTLGLFLGSFSMSFLLALKSFQLPTELWDPLNICMALFLFMALLSLFTHIVGLTIKALK